MSDLEDRLRAAFEDEGHDVSEVSTNRDRIRVALSEEGAQADRLRAIVHGVVGEDGAFGLDVTSETVEGGDGVRTVVSFRNRS